MLERVVEINSCYSMFASGQKVGVAVSGGADSVCLLHVLVALAPRWNLKLEVLHLNHGLRGEESEEDARFVAAMAATLGLPVHARRVDLRQVGENLEQAARNARREFFLSFLNQRRLDRVATGHTRSDQAETVLFRILRGSGLTGLAGVLPVTAEGLVRPLLHVSRPEVEAWLRERGIEWRTDSTNSDPAFRRNLIRRDLLPQLTQEWNPALEDALCQMSVLAQEDEVYWTSVIPEVAGMAVRLDDGAAYVQLESLSKFPAAVQRRLLRHAIRLVKGDLREIEFRHVEEIMRLVRALDGHGRMQAPGVDVLRSLDWLQIARPSSEVLERKNFRLKLEPPCQVAPPGWCSTIHLEVTEPGNGYNGGSDDVEWTSVSGPLELRNWRPGDRIKRAGQPAEESLKQLFQEARIPLWNRRKWPIITTGDQLIWARQFGVHARCAASSGSRQVLRIREEFPGT